MDSHIEQITWRRTLESVFSGLQAEEDYLDALAETSAKREKAAQCAAEVAELDASTGRVVDTLLELNEQLAKLDAATVGMRDVVDGMYAELLPRAQATADQNSAHGVILLERSSPTMEEHLRATIRMYQAIPHNATGPARWLRLAGIFQASEIICALSQSYIRASERRAKSSNS
jgi:hypothetical protein